MAGQNGNFKSLADLLNLNIISGHFCELAGRIRLRYKSRTKDMEVKICQ